MGATRSDGSAGSSFHDRGGTVSFRDPGGCVVALDRRILRVVNQDALAVLRSFLASSSARRLVADGLVVRSEFLDETEVAGLLENAQLKGAYESRGGCAVVEHERVAFPSFPYEWPPEMLHEAARLTLEICERTLTDGYCLKDASPYNVLFRGPSAVFVDVLSFERREAGDSTWLPYAQYVRNFLLPLLVHRRLGVGMGEVFATRRDGLEPEEVYAMLGRVRRLSPRALSLVSLPTWLGSRDAAEEPARYRPPKTTDPEKARFVLTSLLGHLKRHLGKLEPRDLRRSAWSEYATKNSYTPEQAAAKEAFVAAALSEFRPERVLDVGCNTGRFSALAARSGASVVSIDYDPVVVGRVWRDARAEGLDILPLAVNLARPSPGTGWRNRECPSFLDRARGRFDAVLMLAVLHHILVTERIPLPEVVDLAAELTTGMLVVEFVAPEDPMFRRISRGRDDLHRDLTLERFEEAFLSRFSIVRSERLGDAHRWLYLFRK
jgi:SAM-dependent methyltransferase